MLNGIESKSSEAVPFLEKDDSILINIINNIDLKKNKK